jgi:molecular chaperone HtpG
MRQHRQFDGASKRILEINPEHALIRRLAAEVSKPGAGERLDDIANLLLDQARLVDGEPLPDPAAFARRLSAALEKALGG